MTKKIRRHTKKKPRKRWPVQRKNKATDTNPGKNMMADLLDKNFKTCSKNSRIKRLKMLQELKEDVWKVKKTFCMNKMEMSIQREKI